jgi:hypothetical protein
MSTPGISHDGDSTTRVLDVALRGAATLLLLIAGLLVREYGRATTARLGAGFAIGVGAYTICSAVVRIDRKSARV